MCPNHKVVEFKPPELTSLYLGSDANYYTIFNPPAPPVPTLLCIIFFPSPWTYLLSPTQLSPIDTASLSICTLVFPPLLPSRGAAVHLGGAPIRRLPPLVYASLPCSSHIITLCEPCLPSPIWLPPLAILNICPCPCWPQGSTVQGSLPPSACLPQPHACSPPLPTLTAGLVLCLARVVASCSSSHVTCASAYPSLIYSASSIGFF